MIGTTQLQRTRRSIAHDKLIIISEGDAMPIVLIGPFNFTKAAQRSNAENIIEIVDNRNVATAYAANFMSRKAVSVPYEFMQGTRIN